MVFRFVKVYNINLEKYCIFTELSIDATYRRRKPCQNLKKKMLQHVGTVLLLYTLPLVNPY